MCYHATKALPPEPLSAPAARDFLRRCYSDWGLTAMVEDSELALSELVTNAVLHARTPLLVSISCADSIVELAVFDGTPTRPTMRPHRSDLAGDLAAAHALEAELDEVPHERDPRLHVGPAGSVTGGRGLLVVDAVAAQWGVSPLSDGKAVWARTPVFDGWEPVAPCPCSASDQALTLASGHPVVER